MDSTKQLGPIARAIYLQAWLAEGRHDALSYVIGCEGDIEQISQELQERRENIAHSGEKGGMSPGTSPRMYLDSYLATLKEALEIVTRLRSEGKTWFKEPGGP